VSHAAPRHPSISKERDLKTEEAFRGLYLRHVPATKNCLLGVVSIRDVVRANLLDKDREIRELKSVASWQYDENWGWDRKNERHPGDLAGGENDPRLCGERRKGPTERRRKPHEVIGRPHSKKKNGRGSKPRPSLIPLPGD
jgi:hypothetical protein